MNTHPIALNTNYKILGHQYEPLYYHLPFLLLLNINFIKAFMGYVWALNLRGSMSPVMEAVISILIL